MRAHARRVGLCALALAGIACGVAAGIVFSDTEERAGAGTDEPIASSGDREARDATAPTATAPTTTVGPPSTSATPTPAGPLLVWTTGGLPAGFEQDVAAVAAVAERTLVRGDDVELTRTWTSTGAVVDEVAPGWFIPLDALAVDLGSYARVVPGADAVVAALRAPGSVVLSEASAQVRGIDAGGRIDVGGGHELTVTAVVADELVAAAEIVVSVETGATIGVTTPRSMLLRYTGDRAALERELSEHRGSRGIRFREGAETSYLRHGDAVLPQSLIKARFGEFSARHAGGAWLELDPDWVAENIRDVTLPVLGATQCHKDIAPLLDRALGELEDDGLTSLVDPSDFGGCFAPRLIGSGLGVSRHAWGVAVDVNVAANPLGGTSTQDERLVDVMRRAGMAWGGEWLRPDPMHFEYLTPPR